MKELQLTTNEIRAYLNEHTNMTAHDIDKHINDGCECYLHSMEGYELFKSNWIAGMNNPDDALRIWNDEFEKIGDYRFDWALQKENEL